MATRSGCWGHAVRMPVGLFAVSIAPHTLMGVVRDMCSCPGLWRLSAIPLHAAGAHPHSICIQHTRCANRCHVYVAQPAPPQVDELVSYLREADPFCCIDAMLSSRKKYSKPQLSRLAQMHIPQLPMAQSSELLPLVGAGRWWAAELLGG